MKKRMRQLTAVNSTLIFKYTCTLCMCEEIHVQKWDMYKHTCICIILSHMYICCVQYTALDSTSCGRTGTCINKYGVLRKKVASLPGSPLHERRLILDLCTRTKMRQGRAWYVISHA